MSGGGTGDARVVCAGCGCLCDDVRLEYDPGRGRPDVLTDCAPGRRWVGRQVAAAAGRERRPAVGGEPASLEEAAARAAELLAGAVHPRVEGLERLPLGAQRKLVELADRAGAGIDVGASAGHLGTVLAVQRDGGHFLTLGEVRERVDCLVLWFVEPGRTHPRLLERFYPSGGDGEADGARDRAVVAVGPRAEETGADVAVTAEPGDSTALLWLLRLLADDADAPERREHPLGGAAATLLEALRGASSGAWVYGAGGGAAGRGGDAAAAGPAAGRGGAQPAGAGADPVETSGVLRLLLRLNEDAPWGARPLAGEGNPAGAEAVLTWQSGFPAAVTYRDGRPRYAGDAHAAHRPPAADADVVLRAGGDPPAATAGTGAAWVWLDTGSPPEGTSRGEDPAPDGAGGGDAGPDRDPAAEADLAVRIPVLPPGALPGETLLRMDGLPVRSPGLPGAGDRRDVWPAEEALEAVLEQTRRIEREEAGP